MIEPEHIKVMTLIMAAAAAKVTTVLASPITPDQLTVWVERGGTVLTIGLLVYACKAMREALAGRQKRLDEMHDEQMRNSEKQAEAREKLAIALEKLTAKLNGRENK